MKGNFSQALLILPWKGGKTIPKATLSFCSYALQQLQQFHRLLKRGRDHNLPLKHQLHSSETSEAEQSSLPRQLLAGMVNPKLHEQEISCPEFRLPGTAAAPFQMISEKGGVYSKKHWQHNIFVCFICHQVVSKGYEIFSEWVLSMPPSASIDKRRFEALYFLYFY